MLDWLADNLALIMFVSMFFFIFIGYPVAFIMGGLALAFAVFGAWLGTFNLVGLSDIVLRMWGGVANDPVLASIPMPALTWRRLPRLIRTGGRRLARCFAPMLAWRSG